jgi:energy-coupling factor transporter ATP-binding protein EcfA2
VETISLFEIEDLTYYYPDSRFPALRNINLALEQGEFMLSVGGSGSGKSTLARLLAGLVPDYYGGRICGRVLWRGRPLRESQCCPGGRVGIVFQDPEKQLVMTSVEAEIAFGLENLGLPQQEMFRRVAEVMSFLNLSPLKNEFTANLSGGQKQKVALASVLAMKPGVLILDEPTSQLDPAAADEFLYLVERLNREMGYTVLLIEQRLDRCFHLADRVVFMSRGEILHTGAAAEAARWQVRNSFPYLPPVTRFFISLGSAATPLTVKDGRRELEAHLAAASPEVPAAGVMDRQVADPGIARRRVLNVRTGTSGRQPPGKLAGGMGGAQAGAQAQSGEERTAALEVSDVWFTYENGREALKGASLTVARGDFLVVLGENAAGKSTLLKLISGLLKPGRGRVTVLGEDTRRSTPAMMARKVGYLSQNPNDYLFEDTVEDELRFTINNLGLAGRGIIDDILARLSLAGVRGANPRDLSGGERQRVALASVLAAGPELLLLDEPTRGLDYTLKNELGRLLQDLGERGLTTVLVTHDVEFAAEYARNVAFMFDGRITASGARHQVLKGSAFYSPQIARLFNNIADDVVTVGDALEKMRGLEGGSESMTSRVRV